MKLIDIVNLLPCDKRTTLCIFQYITDDLCTYKHYVHNPKTKVLRIPKQLLNRSVMEIMPCHNVLHITLDKEGVQE